MFFHIGNSKIIFNSDLIGIFNLDSTGNRVKSKVMEVACLEAVNFNSGKDRPRSFIVTDHNIYVSPISPQTLSKRYNSSGSVINR